MIKVAYKYTVLVLKFSVPLTMCIMKRLTIQQGSLYPSNIAGFCCPYASKFLPCFAPSYLGSQIMQSALLSSPSPPSPPQLLHAEGFVLFINFQISYNGLILKPSPELNWPLTLLPEQSALKCPRLKMLADYNGNINTVQRTKKFSFTFNIQLIQISECISL